MSEAIHGQDTSSRRRVKGATLIVVGLAVCIVPYFVSIGLPIYLVGAVRVLKSNQTMKSKVMVLGVSFAILVGYYAWLLSLPGW
jgi:F0F1-type ATP synthase membrane subunit c/vacuolar-type H+-ATPase subunit K